MSKSDPPQLPAQRPRERRPYIAIALLTALLLLAWRWVRHDEAPRPTSNGLPDSNHLCILDWDDVPTSETLLWVPCFCYVGPFLCARLTVPMDYDRPLNASPEHPKVHIAMVMLPGAGHGLSTGRFSESPLLVNPGGPGGSGTEFVLAAGPGLQAVAGRDRDVVGFDPRGTGRTVPKADCFLAAAGPPPPTYAARNDALLHRVAYALMAHDVGLPNSSAVAMGKHALRARAFAAMCARGDGDAGGLRYLATPHVARDMKTIIGAWDQWLEAEGLAAELPAVGGVEAAGSLPWPPSTKGKLVFWGFSYGTLLGATFAAMFPDSVGRLVLDGVVDADIYVRPSYIDSMVDADAIIDSLFYHCHAARSECALYRDGDSVANVSRRFHDTMEALRENPVIIAQEPTRMPLIITASDIRQVLFASLYAPVKQFPLVALIVDMIHRGQPLESLAFAPDFKAMCNANLKLRNYPDDSLLAVSCSDHQYEVDETPAGLQKSFEEIAQRTSLADVWIWAMTGCSFWKIKAEFPWAAWSDRLLHGTGPVNTSHPILFVGNTHDPVTPLRAAVKMAGKFARAGVLEVQTGGHCSIASVSLCAILRIRNYLQWGLTPAPPRLEPGSGGGGGGAPRGEWEKCRADERPWKPFKADDQVELLDDELEVVEGWKLVQANSDEILRHASAGKLGAAHLAPQWGV